MAVSKVKNFELYHDPSNPYTTFPIHNNDVWDMYKKAVSCFWTPEEIDFSKDREQWENQLKDDEKTFIKNILAFFAASDGIVSENLDINFTQGIDVREVKCFYRFQNMIEDIHSETYSLMIETFIINEDEKLHALNAINTIPCVGKKADWAVKWTKSETASIAEKIFAFIIVEGLFFSGAFASIYWLKQRNLMPGLTFSNQLISRDEGLHTDFGIFMYNKCGLRLDENVAVNIMKEAVQIEDEFINESIPCAMIGMNSNSMKQYIKYIADRLLVLTGYSKIYKESNPFDFMENIGLEEKGNFFEMRISQYSKAGVGSNDKNGNDFDLDADF